jgi:CRP/FNR family transcriptional regulator
VRAQHTNLAAVLGQTALLVDLSPVELQQLAVRAVRKVFRAGELLFSEGEACGGLHILAQGRVRLFKTSAKGREQVLAVNLPGETIAEIPVFDGGPYPASAVAVEDVEIVYISRQDFQAYCLEHPAVALKMLVVTGGRLRSLVGIIEELSFTTIRERLISFLVKLAKSEGKQTAHGVAFQLPVNHQELANQLGTVRELISRNLIRLQDEGLIEVNSKQIAVKDIAAMQANLHAEVSSKDRQK